MPLVDKALVNGEDLGLTPTGDFKIVEDNETHLQAAEIRCLAILGSWFHDPALGSGLYQYNKSGNIPELVTETQIRTYIESALQPMIADGRILSVAAVKIVERTSDEVFVEVTVDIGTQIGTIILQVNP